MDNRWSPSKNNTVRSTRVFWQPTASVEDLQLVLFTKDGIELTKYVSSGSQTSNSMSITLNYSSTDPAFATLPQYGQMVNTVEDGQVLAIMMIESISSFAVSFGTRTLTITARTREQADIWKLSKFVTNSYPQGTVLSTIISDVATQVGLIAQDLALIPVSSVTTSHTNTQLANISAWQMMTTLMLPLGQQPAIDCIGRLKGLSKDLVGRNPDITYTEDRLVKEGGTRNRPPASRYILNWLDPNLTMVQSQGRKLAQANITAGFFTPLIWKHLGFSEDGTQRATDTYLRPKTSVNQFRIGGTVFLPCFLEFWVQDTPVNGKIIIITLGWTYVALAAAWIEKGVAHKIPDGVTTALGFGITVPKGRLIEYVCDIAIFTIMAAMGTGDYEIWGVPYDLVHARNSSEAYDSSALAWLDNPVTEECDFIMNEAHAQAVCTRELVYQARSANTQTQTIIEDRRVEKGDIIEFSDGTSLYVLDFTRTIKYGSDNTLELSGFLANG